MDKLLSIGLDVGTTTTQLIVSELLVENKGNAFSVPEMVIGERKLLYQSPVTFTPLISGELVDGEKIAAWVEAQYKTAGITKQQVDTGAVIITGETYINGGLTVHGSADEPMSLTIKDKVVVDRTNAKPNPPWNIRMRDTNLYLNDNPDVVKVAGAENTDVTLAYDASGIINGFTDGTPD